MSKKNKINSQIFIFCNTDETEPVYFQDIRNELHSNIIQRPKKIKKSPWQLIKKAIEFKNTLKKEDNDMVWRIFDTDNYFNENPQEFLEAIKKAKENDIYLGITNKCFELWLLLHFVKVDKSMDAKELEKTLKKYVPKYTKKYPIFLDIKEKTAIAIKNNKKINSGKYNQIDWQNFLNKNGNPSSSIYYLIEQIQIRHKDN